MVGAWYSGFTDFALGQLLDRGSAQALDLYKVRPLEPIKNACKEEELSRKGAALRHELETLAPRPLGQIFSTKVDLWEETQGVGKPGSALKL